MQKHFKLAFIGAGSIGFTRGLLSDILSVPEFSEIEVSFMDINPNNLDMVYQLCQRDIEANGLNIKIHATTDRREALKGAKYIIDCARIGGLEAFRTDVDIPLKYGVDQCVGDTLCAGGIMYAQRDIAMLEGMCRDIREVAAPGCMLLNYTNPNAMVTWYCNHYGKVRTVGLCHGVQGGHHLIARVLGYEKKDIDIICAGINHMTWYLSDYEYYMEYMPEVILSDLIAFYCDPIEVTYGDYDWEMITCAVAMDKKGNISEMASEVFVYEYGTEFRPIDELVAKLTAPQSRAKLTLAGRQMAGA